MPSHFAAKFGGAELQVQLLIETILRRERLELVYLARNVVAEFDDPRYGLIRIPHIRGVQRLGFWPDRYALLKLLRREQPDLIYQRVGCAYTGYAAAYARKAGVPLVWHVSIDSDLEPGIGRFSPGIAAIERLLRDYGIRHADAIVAQSNDQRRRLLERYNRTSTVIHNFQQPPESTLPKSSMFTVVWVANLKSAKRPELFLEIVRRFRGRNDMKFVMVGRGGDRAPYQDQLRSCISDCGDLFEFKGELSPDAANRCLQRSHVFVNTSDDEGFPNTLIQCWFREVAVITLGVDPDHALSRNHIGSVVESVTGAVQQINWLHEHREEWQSMVSRARRYVHDNHGMANADRLVDLLVDQLGR
jgi:glycosyltransferase involved in cell wall biosynthesis